MRNSVKATALRVVDNKTATSIPFTRDDLAKLCEVIDGIRTVKAMTSSGCQEFAIDYVQKRLSTDAGSLLNDIHERFQEGGAR